MSPILLLASRVRSRAGIWPMRRMEISSYSNSDPTFHQALHTLTIDFFIRRASHQGESEPAFNDEPTRKLGGSARRKIMRRISFGGCFLKGSLTSHILLTRFECLVAVSYVGRGYQMVCMVHVVYFTSAFSSASRRSSISSHKRLFSSFSSRIVLYGSGSLCLELSILSPGVNV